MTLAGSGRDRHAQKVIGEHSTIGLVVTTDGSSFTELPREAYIPAEKRVIEELQSLGKPFLVLVNSSEPNGEAAQRNATSCSRSNGITPIAVNCLELDEAALRIFCSRCCMNFRSARLVFLPRYIGTLPLHHPVQNSIYQCIRTAAANGEKMRDVQKLCRTLEENGNTSERASVDNMALGRELGGRACRAYRKPYSTALSASRPAFRCGMTQI